MRKDECEREREVENKEGKRERDGFEANDNCNANLQRISSESRIFSVYVRSNVYKSDHSVTFERRALNI